jgi:hypothetical protein
MYLCSKGKNEKNENPILYNIDTNLFVGPADRDMDFKGMLHCRQGSAQRYADICKIANIAWRFSSDPGDHYWKYMQ